MTSSPPPTSSAPAPPAPTARDKRPYDVVLWGATGFAGELVAEYLAAKSLQDSSFTWAIAARSATKLEALLRDLKEATPGLVEPAILIAESFDRDSLRVMARQARVVCSTVGPYAKYGSDLVEVCVEERTDYCDLTGETHWVKRMIDAHHTRAHAEGTRIVHFCGFDSIPSDLGALLLQRHAIETHGVPCEEIRYFLVGASGGFSGGTVASMLNLFEEGEQDREVFRIAANPYSLNPPDKKRGPKQLSDMRYGKDDFIDGWVAPFIMASVNTRVVRRSNALMHDLYGEHFRYSEAIKIKKGGVAGAAGATALTGGFAAFGSAMAFKPTRKALKRFALPAPGEGPSRDKIERGYFKVELVGRARGETLRATVRATKDPGYGATALMLGESALCLARDTAQTGALGYTIKGGVLTPASAMGEVLIERLVDAGMTLKIRERR